MAARAISSAAISFGMVSIPVKMFTSSETSNTISFRTLHADCGSRLKQQYICPKHDVEVPLKERAKGYEFSKNQYVVFSKEELKALEAKSTHTIDIEEFVPAAAINRLYIDRIYFLAPDVGGARAYQLLREALTQTDRVAIAKYAARGKDYLVAVRPLENGLLLEQLKYQTEMRPMSEIPIDDVDLKDAEVKLAIQLVDQVANDKFDAGKYKDEVRSQIQALIEKKLAGEEIAIEPEEEQETKIVNLMDALKASIEATSPKQAKRSSAKKKATRKKKAG